MAQSDDHDATATWLANRRSPECGELMRGARLAIVPIGAHEQHGPALPVATDTITATALANRIGARHKEEIVIAPTIPWGVSWHHTGLPGTISLQSGTLVAVVCDVVASLHRHGIERVVLLNTHGGNNAALRQAAESCHAELGVPMVVSLFAYQAIAAATRRLANPDMVGHGGGDEASVMLATAPELVDRSMLGEPTVDPAIRRLLGELTETGSMVPLRQHLLGEQGTTGDASGASGALGERILQDAVEHLDHLLERIMTTPLEPFRRSVEEWRPAPPD